MKRIIPRLQYLMKPAVLICLTCLLAGPLLANEDADAKLEKARTVLTGESKDTAQAKKLLLDIVEHDKDTLDPKSLCYVYVYLGYIEDRAGNRNEAIPWYRKALEIKDADGVQECATYGMEKPLVWIRHLDEGAGEMKLQKARAALTGETKDTAQAKKLLLDIVEHDKDTLDPKSLCYVYVYLGYIEDRAGNRNEAIPWYRKALEIKDADGVQECATYGMEKPLVWIRHLDEGAGEMKLQKARAALTGETKDTAQAKKLLLDIVEHDKDTLDSKSLCYVYVYLGYIEDRAGNRNEAIPWYQKALEIKGADWVQECAAVGLQKPLTWIRHLDEGTEKISPESAPPVVVKTVPEAGSKDVSPGEVEIKVTFSKEMMNQSWSWSSAWENSTPEGLGKPRYESDQKTCVIKVKLEPNKTYGYWINSQNFHGFKDTQGHSAVPYLLVFQTKGN